MKLNRLSLAVLLAAPILANAGVTISPMAGYHSYDNSDVHQRKATAALRAGQPGGEGVALYDKEAAFGGAVGVELTPTLTFEADYNETQTKAATLGAMAPQQRFDARQQLMSGNFLVGLGHNAKFKPYALVGAGVSKIYAKNIQNRADKTKTNDTIGNLGLGTMYRVNDHLALRGEVRQVRNFDHNWWETLALAGLQVTLGNHLGAVVPVVAAPVATVVDEPEAPEPVKEVVATVVDSDGDGVADKDDQCPNTAAGVVVDATGCPKVVVAPTKLELRVFFDTNKSKIKPQFKPEIKKAADTLKAIPSATAKLEGHTDNRGPRSLNDRLSLARANAVKSTLVKEYGIAATRLTTEGFADTRPVAPNTTDEGRAMNRRVYAVISGDKSAK